MHTSDDSRTNWISNRVLDIVVESFSVLEEKKAQRQQQNLPRRQQLWTASAPPLDPNKKVLRLASVYGGADDDQEEKKNFTKVLVDDMVSIKAFAQALGQLLRKQTTDADYSLVGIDCEWRPFELTPGEPRPVLLLQISFHEDRTVYLMDLQAILRPLMPASQLMDKAEKEVSFALSALFGSKRLIKVGFQIVDDLRQLAASYPHLESLHFYHSVVDIGILAKKVLRRSKSGNNLETRQATGSLARMVDHFLHAQLNKTEQCSDWSQRPLSREQQEYAALDAAVSPVLVEAVMANTTIDMAEFLQSERMLSSCRFVFVDDGAPSFVLKRLKAKRVVGDARIVSQSWLTGCVPPALPEVSGPVGGAFRDERGILQIPSTSASIAEVCKNDKKRRSYSKLLGTTAGGKSKEQCVAPLLSALPAGGKLDFSTRSGYIEFSDGVALFVRMLPAQQRPRTYPNEWLDAKGRSMSWFIRNKEWVNRTLSQKMLQYDQHPVILFTRLGDGPFVCCGACSVHPFANTTTSVEDDWELKEFRLDLLDWEALKEKREFRSLVNGIP